MRLAHAADLHLGAMPYSIPAREIDIYNVFEEMVEKVIEERAEVLILAGDIFDKSVPKNAARRHFRKNLKKLREKGVRVMGILGDHDIPKMFDIPPTADIDPEDFLLLEAAPKPKSSLEIIAQRYYHDKENDLVVTGLVARKSGRKEHIAVALKEAERYLKGHRYKVLVLHQAIKEKWPFDATAIPMGLIPRDVDYVAMGHIHNAHEMRWNAGKLVYPGSIEALRKDEWNGGNKGFYIVDLEGDFVETQFVKLERVRPQGEFRLGEDSIEDMKAFVASCREKPIIHIIVPAKMPKSRYASLMDEIRNTTPFRPEDNRVLSIRVYFEKFEEESGGGLTGEPKKVALEEVIREIAGDKADLIIKLLSISKSDMEKERAVKELEKRILEWMEREDKED